MNSRGAGPGNRSPNSRSRRERPPGLEEVAGHSGEGDLLHSSRYKDDVTSANLQLLTAGLERLR